MAALSHSKFYAKVHLIVGFISVADISCYICVTILYKVINPIPSHHWRSKLRILKTNVTRWIKKLTISSINNWIMQWTGANGDAHTDIRALRSPYCAAPCWWKLLYLNPYSQGTKVVVCHAIMEYRSISIFNCNPLSVLNHFSVPSKLFRIQIRSPSVEREFVLSLRLWFDFD